MSRREPGPRFTKKVASFRVHRAGRPNAARAVGNILNRYGGMDVGVPCHRVIRSDGTPGGYAWGPKKKIAMLKKEKAL